MMSLDGLAWRFGEGLEGFSEAALILFLMIILPALEWGSVINSIIINNPQASLKQPSLSSDLVQQLQKLMEDFTFGEL